MVILFSMIFVAVVGGGGIYFTWRRGRAASEARLPISDRPAQARGQHLALLLFGAFFLLGCGLVYGLVWIPVRGILDARQWPAVPCIVLSSEVESHNTSDSTTYKVNIRYRYEFNGRPFENDRYDFMIGWTSGRDGKQAIVDRLSPGTRTVCYVNPADSTEAVLERGFTPALWSEPYTHVFIAK